MGWATPQDNMFRESRSMPGAIFVLSMTHWPYVFLTVQASFLRQPTNQIAVVCTRGTTTWGTLLAVILPQARPAIVVGVSLALMECLNDIAAVGFCGVPTPTLGI
jgi:iron(III) transport system permease protein